MKLITTLEIIAVRDVLYAVKELLEEDSSVIQELDECLELLEELLYKDDFIGE